MAPRPKTQTMAGWLVWYTIPSSSWNLQDAQDAAVAAEVPQNVIDRLRIMSDMSAWLRSTQLRSRGKASRGLPGENGSHTSRWFTRDIDTGIRLLVRETLDAQNVVLTARTAGCITFQGGIRYEEAQHDGNANWSELQNLARTEVIAPARDEYHKLTEVLHDSRVRAAVSEYLEERNRVGVRGAGGVYYVPQTGNNETNTRIQGELLNLRNWLLAMKASFSVVKLYKDDATTIEDITKSALEELRERMGEMNSKLEAWRQNPAMNDGSRMYSTGEILQSLDKIDAMVENLRCGLGTDIDVAATMASLIRRQAEQLNRSAVEQVSKRKEEQAAAKAESAIKKSGTAKDRQAAVQF